MRHSGYSSSDTWYEKDNPHIIDGDTTVSNLIIEAGCKIYFNSSFSLISSTGLQVNGTKEKPVLFTVNTASPTRGYWNKIELGGSGDVTIKNAIIEYGTYNLRIAKSGSATITIENVISSQANYQGMRLQSGTSNTTNLSKCIVYDCNLQGVHIASSQNYSMKNCLIYNCGKGLYGAHGVYDYNQTGSSLIENCTIDNCGQSAGYHNLVKYFMGTAILTIRNCIVTNGPGYGISGGNKTLVSYSNVWNNTVGNLFQCSDGGGNTYVDPKYVGSGDYHLQSTKGSYHDGAWTVDANDSSSLDTGDPSSDYSKEPEYNAGRVNKGMSGGTGEASRSRNNVTTKGYATKSDWDSGIKIDTTSDISIGNLAISTATAVESIVQDSGTIETNCEVYGANDIGQQFKTTKQRLQKISLYGKKVGTPPNNCILKIWHNDAGDVFKSLSFLTSVSNSSGDFGNSLAYVDFILPVELDLALNTNLILTLEMESDGGDSSNKYVFTRSDSDQYADGNMVYSTDDWVTTNDYSSYDLRFKISEADVKSSGTWTKDFEASQAVGWGKFYFEGSGVQFRFKSADTQPNLEGAAWSSYIGVSGSQIPIGANRWLRVEAKLQV